MANLKPEIPHAPQTTDGASMCSRPFITCELATEIDRLAGPKKRSAYAIEILQKEIQRIRQKAALRATRGAWKSDDHPELADGGAAYVEQLRSEPEERFESALRQQGT